MFEEVLEVAFQGCGQSLAQARNSARFRALVAKETKLAKKFSRTSTQALALRVGTLEWGALLNTGKLKQAIAAARALPAVEHDPERRAEIHLLGELLVQKAAICLPRKVRALAKKWKRSSRSKQREIAQQVTASFKAGDGKNYFVQRETQTADVVLPAKFRHSLFRHGVEPNCLGKALIVAAFARLAGAHARSVVPIELAEGIYAPAHADVALRTLRALRRPGVRAGKPFRDSLHGIVAHGSHVRSIPSWLHMSVAIERRAGDWLVIDPNMGSYSRTKHFQVQVDPLRDIDRVLGKFEAVTPGLTLLVHYPEMEATLRLVRQWFAAIFRAGEAFHHRVQRGRFGARAAVRMLMWSDGLSELLSLAKEYDLSRTFDNVRCSRELEKVFKGKRPRKTLKNRTTAACLVLRWAINQVGGKIGKDGVCPTISELSRSPHLKKALAIIPAHLYHRAMRTFETAGTFCSFYPHPYCEVGRLEWNLACAVLGHLGVVMEDWQETEAVLNGLCFSQYRLYHHMLTLIHGDRRKQHIRAKRSAEILGALRYRLRSADIILAALREEGSLSSKVRRSDRHAKKEGAPGSSEPGQGPHNARCRKVDQRHQTRAAKSHSRVQLHRYSR